MTTDAAPAPAPPRAGRNLRLWAVLALLVLATGVLIAVIGPRDDRDKQPLDPTSTRGNGSQALARVLERQGVEVQRQSRWAQVRDGDRRRTLLVSQPDTMPPDLLKELPGTARHVVLVAPSDATVDALGAHIVTLDTATTPAKGSPPHCDLPAARAAGSTPLRGTGYARVADVDSTGVHLCFPMVGPDSEDTGMLAQWRHKGTTFTAIGSTDILQNSRIADQRGRAALGLWLLGEDPRLTWWMVDVADPAFAPGDGRAPVDPFSLLPGWYPLVGWWLLAVAVLAAVWRGRRLGALVPEPLPVVVRSAETTIGRAALYRQIRARDRAADLIRRRTLTRLRPLLGLGARAPVDEVVVAAAAATGWPQARLDGLLRPGPVPDDPTLLTITREAEQLLRGLDWLAPGPVDDTPHRKGPQ